jgi:hypothetical protein
MSKTIQVRHVPEKVHRALKARAARAGLSLSDYLLTELRRLAGRPTLDELVERIRLRGAAQVTEDPASAVRDERESR